MIYSYTNLKPQQILPTQTLPIIESPKEWRQAFVEAPVTTPLYSAPEVPALARGLVLCSLVLTYLTNVTWMAGGLSDMSFATIYLKHVPGGLKTVPIIPGMRSQSVLPEDGIAVRFFFVRQPNPTQML